jgi:lipoate-protein ligase A
MKMNPGKAKVIISDRLDVRFNLAIENYLFRGMRPASHIMFLWVNSPAVVIGRYQNPWLECRLGRMSRDGVKLARRQSGGGAVYHDEGNLNFTFMSDASDYDKDINFEIIIRALSAAGLKAEVNKRNDILLDGKKISGSAFKLTKKSALHHGTLLIDTNLDLLTSYLNPAAGNISSKGIKSVRSGVTNIRDYKPEATVSSIGKELENVYLEYYPGGVLEHLDYPSLERNSELTDYYSMMGDKDWIYGKSPDFSHEMKLEFPWGRVGVKLHVQKGLIDAAELISGELDLEQFGRLSQSLRGCQYSAAGVLLSGNDLTEVRRAIAAELEGN